MAGPGKVGTSALDTIVSTFMQAWQNSQSFHTPNLKVIASPRDCREVAKQRKETPGSSLIFRDQHLDHKPQVMF